MIIPQSLYHLVDSDEWDDEADYAPASLRREGFIHLSTREQLLDSANRFFADVDNVLAVEVAPDKLHAELLYEQADNQHFPHLYGRLNRDAVVSVVRLERGGNEEFLPPSIRKRP